VFALVLCVYGCGGFFRAGAVIIDLHHAVRVAVCGSYWIQVVVFYVELILAEKIRNLLAEHALVHFGDVVKVGHFFARARIEYSYEGIRGDVVIVNELLAVHRVEIDLEEDEVGLDDLFDRVVAPQVSVQALTRKVSLILHVQEDPLALSTSFRFRLEIFSIHIFQIERVDFL
jgi:hypothetical protein